jgi:Asp-tRNA(Asn)/Glu-tRNA(Gln) amidotransferase B subunit
MDMTAALFSQAELCDAAGIENETANNWIKRGLLEPTKVGGRKIRGRRLFSLLDIFKAHLMNEAIKHLAMPPSQSAQIAKQAITTFIKTEELLQIRDDQKPEPTVACVVQQGNQWIVDVRAGGRALKSLLSRIDKEARLKEHPFAIFPISQAFNLVHQKCLEFLRTTS